MSAWRSPISDHPSHFASSTSAPTTPAMPRVLEAYFEDPYSRPPQHLPFATSAPSTPVVPRVLETCFQDPFAKQMPILQPAWVDAAPSRHATAYWDTVREKAMCHGPEFGECAFTDQHQQLLASPVSSESASDITSIHDSPLEPMFLPVEWSQPYSSQRWYTNVH